MTNSAALLTLLLSFFLSALGETAGDRTDTRLKVDTTQLHPTQMLIGELEVGWRKTEMLSVVKKEGVDGLKAYLKDKAGTVIKGPHSTYWIVDGHHHAKALDDLKGEAVALRKVEQAVDLLHDWSDLSAAEFQAAMKRGAKQTDKEGLPLVFLENAEGKMIPFSELPTHLSGLKDHPLRSVVWLLEKADAIEKVKGYPFQEFVIAKHLPKKIVVTKPTDSESYLTTTRAALFELVGADKKLFPGLQNYAKSDIDKMLQKASDKLKHLE